MRSALTRERPANALATARLPFLAQLGATTLRTLRVSLRNPFPLVVPLLIGLFFLFIYLGQLGQAASFFLRGQDYLGFILPLSIVSAAFSGAGLAGQSLVRDLESGYFDKLQLTPVSRPALVLGPILAAGLVLIFQTLLLLAVGLLLGLEVVTGWPGLLALLGYTLLVGIGFGSFTVGVALLSGNAAATEGASFLVFPLSFLTATFVPLNLLEGWLRVAARANPITYVLDATRSLVLTGWEPEALFSGLLAGLVLAALGFGFALSGLRARAKQR